MIQLLYISTARTPLSPPELESLLAVARRNNLAADVTGLLVVGGRRFLQILEGPEPAVLAIYERIARDPRHAALVKLKAQAITQRSFSRWSMGFERGGAESAAGTLEEQISAIIAPIADPNIKAQFAAFAKKHSQT